MFNNSSSNGSKKKVEATQAVHTLLGKGTIWKGDIHSGPNSIRIEGTVEGTIHSEGEVTIAPSGIVKGTIHAKHLIVTGRVEGIFKIAECLEIHGTGWVEGEVEVGSLVVDEGGTLQGSCTRKGAAQAQGARGGQGQALRQGRGGPLSGPPRRCGQEPPAPPSSPPSPSPSSRRARPEVPVPAAAFTLH